MTEQSEHLSSAQIENYGNRTSGAGPDEAKGDEHWRVHRQGSDNQSSNDRYLDDQSFSDQSANDQSSDDQRANAQRIEAHLDNCASCRHRVLDFHRHHFELLAQPERAGSTSSNTGLADSMLADSTSSESRLANSTLADSNLASSRLESARPTDSALADSKFANSKYPVQAQVRTAPTPECPSDDALRQLAAGLTPDALAAQLTQHAATCDHCGPLLRTFTEDFSDDFTPEEQAALTNLKSSSAQWHKNTARQMLEAGSANAAALKPSKSDKKPSAERRVSSSLGRKPFFWKWTLVPAATAVVALAAFSFWHTQRDTPEKVAQLLNQAYPQQRSAEMRWPGAAWGVPKETLGPVSLNPPRPLLAAKDAIQRQSPETLKKAEWLNLQARSEILGGKPSKQLIQDLTKATQSNPASEPLLFDLAIANFCMGEVTDDRSYYLQAKTVLDEMLASFPPSSAALFDRAIAEERLQLRKDALADLNRALRLESDPAWSAEIRNKINKLESLP